MMGSWWPASTGHSGPVRVVMEMGRWIVDNATAENDEVGEMNESREILQPFGCTGGQR